MVGDEAGVTPQKVLTRIVGYASEPALAEQLHDVSHKGRLEIITIDRADTARRRLRVYTDKGTDCAIALPREQRLADGAVLELDDRAAIVVRMNDERWLAIKPKDAVKALEVGYFAGNLHWRVAFAGDTLKIALEGPEQNYIDRLSPFFEDGAITRVDDE